MRRARACAAFVLAVLALHVVPGAGLAQDELVGAATLEDARGALVAAGLPEPELVVDDPTTPRLVSWAPDRVTVEARLYGCDARGLCGGVDLVAIVPATGRPTAEATVDAIESSMMGIGAEVLSPATDDGADHAVMLDIYIMYNLGVSRRLLPDMLNYLLAVLDETKGSMLAADSAHAALWVRED